MTRAKIMVIGDAPLVEGFQLVGIETTTLAGEADFQKKLEDALANPEFGIIVVTERLMGNLDWRLRRKLDSIAYPVIVPMPDLSGKSESGDNIRALIKRALGFDLGAKK